MAPRKRLPRFLRSLVSDEPASTKARVIALYILLAAFNLAAWCWAFVAFHRFPVLLGTAFLAYSFGLRHAVDADHIAAIDNVTRKLMQQGKRPVAVGLMFSLGHSTIVIVGSIAIAATALALQHRIDAVREIGGVDRHPGVERCFCSPLRSSISSFCGRCIAVSCESPAR
jgi:high-affinity nickel-transport protein